jgi:hypothetical protein
MFADIDMLDRKKVTILEQLWPMAERGFAVQDIFDAARGVTCSTKSALRGCKGRMARFYEATDLRDFS